MHDRRTFNEIEEQWNRWTKIPFPTSASDMEPNGNDLVSLDTFSAGCIDTFVRNRGKLDRDRINVLRSCVDELESSFGELTGDVKTYFAELLDISRKVLTSSDSNAGI